MGLFLLVRWHYQEGGTYSSFSRDHERKGMKLRILFLVVVGAGRLGSGDQGNPYRTGNQWITLTVKPGGGVPQSLLRASDESDPTVRPVSISNNSDTQQ